MATNLVHSHKQYLKTQIETASQPQLLLMLFDAAVKKLNIAKKAIRDKSIEKSHQELTKVQRIFIELMLALDLEKGGDLAVNLLRIYDFIYHQLVKANIRQDTGMIDEVMPIVENLRNGWSEAVEKFNADAKSGGVEQTDYNKNALPASSQDKGQKPAAPAASAKKPARTNYPMPSKEEPAQRPRLNIRG